jgi:hypothetical protein
MIGSDVKPGGIYSQTQKTMKPIPNDKHGFCTVRAKQKEEHGKMCSIIRINNGCQMVAMSLKAISADSIKNELRVHCLDQQQRDSA